ncbi:DPBB_1 domain-containing protein [Cephalotus follicularis]|uniref:DPBB_1 domain-containing protein n=1 Tax=Cephalotus follicularis TaxID=3775 RepID=A0A1Q3BR84_CEPFO|nr:DPBB_1 domain-containing protein [Cephalotus follicularis]
MQIFIGGYVYAKIASLLHMIYNTKSVFDYTMSLLFSLPFLLVANMLFLPSNGDVGSAAQYNPPYIPTACNGDDATQFPSSNMFAAAGEGIWDNGAACGRLYKVSCISAIVPGTCNKGAIIPVKIVDRAKTSASRPSSDGCTMVLSQAAFDAITNPSSAEVVNIDFQQV